MTDDELRRLLAQIESVLIDAGERCVENYQLDMDWDVYGSAVERVKDLVRGTMTPFIRRGCLDPGEMEVREVAARAYARSHTPPMDLLEAAADAYMDGDMERWRGLLDQFLGRGSVAGGGPRVQVSVRHDIQATGALMPGGSLHVTADDSGPLERVDAVRAEPPRMWRSAIPEYTAAGFTERQATERQESATAMAWNFMQATPPKPRDDVRAVGYFPIDMQRVAITMSHVVGILHRIGAIDESGLAELLRDE